MQEISGESALLEELRRQTAWLRLIATPALRAELTAVLKDEKRKAVYELSTGQATTREIAKAAGVGAASVSRWWNEWEGLGLMRPAGRQGRMAHIVTLDSLGMRGDQGTARPAEGDEGNG